MTTSTGDVNVLNGIATKKKTAQMYRTMAIDAWNWRIEPNFTPDELDAIRRMFAERYPRARKLSEIEQSIIGKCKKALEGGSNEKH